MQREFLIIRGSFLCLVFVFLFLPGGLRGAEKSPYEYNTFTFYLEKDVFTDGGQALHTDGERAFAFYKNVKW